MHSPSLKSEDDGRRCRKCQAPNFANAAEFLPNVENRYPSVFVRVPRSKQSSLRAEEPTVKFQTENHHHYGLNAPGGEALSNSIFERTISAVLVPPAKLVSLKANSRSSTVRKSS